MIRFFRIVWAAMGFMPWCEVCGRGYTGTATMGSFPSCKCDRTT